MTILVVNIVYGCGYNTDHLTLVLDLRLSLGLAIVMRAMCGTCYCPNAISPSEGNQTTMDFVDNLMHIEVVQIKEYPSRQCSSTYAVLSL